MTLGQDAGDLGGQIIDLLLDVALAEFFGGLGEVGADGDDDGRGLGRSDAREGQSGGERCEKRKTTHHTDS
ncbi:hypothetical protein D3C81_1633780 [compost metagenome]